MTDRWRSILRTFTLTEVAQLRCHFIDRYNRLVPSPDTTARDIQDRCRASVAVMVLTDELTRRTQRKEITH